MNKTVKKKSRWLLEYKRNVYSQAGEDGIIEKILEIIPDNNNWCVEFGAWDGKHLSNTRYLIQDKSYSAVLIEGNTQKFEELKRNYNSCRNVIPINEFVGFSKDDNLDKLLSTKPIPYNFDFLSIDIDGNDYHVWKSMTVYEPKVVCIEFNQTIPNEVRFVQDADPCINQGSSLLSLVELGTEKGYELVSVSSWNAFFVKRKYYSLFFIEDNSLQSLRTENDDITYIFSGYDGTIFIRGKSALPWHNCVLTEEKFQQLPKFLRKFPGQYNFFEKVVFKLFKLIRC